MMNLCQCLQNNVVNSKLTYLIYSSLDGSLKMVDGPVLVNNDRVLLESKTFRLTYTAKSS
uniref:TraQ conjugal transfer family protein n=1 Tax=uncultured Duncaniella sp. TaxID=2768039 RepID=UPI0035127227